MQPTFIDRLISLLFVGAFFMKNFKDLIGQRFGKLVVIENMGTNKYKRYLWKCLCDCGKQKVIEGNSLKIGNTRSCGCLNQDRVKDLPKYRHSRNSIETVCGIYKITNPNGAVYIGGSRTIYKRWLRHREARKKIKIHLSIKEYGWRSHTFEIVHQLPLDVDNDTLIRYEQLYIDLYRDTGVEMLNVKDAGSKAKFPLESRIRMSEAQKGKIPWNKALKNKNNEKSISNG